MSTTIKYDFGKLKGSENYEVWSIRAQAALQKEGKWKVITATTATTDSSNVEALARFDSSLKTVLCFKQGPLALLRRCGTPWKTSMPQKGSLQSILLVRLCLKQRW